MAYGKTSSVLSAAFLVLAAGVPLTQGGYELAHGQRPHALDIFLHAPTAQHLRDYEETLTSESMLANYIRPYWHYAQASFFGGIGALAVTGRGGWLFYRPGVEAVIAAVPKGDAPLNAILSFQSQLEARGIHLLLIPMPDKASVYPGRLTGRLEGAAAPIPSPGKTLVERLRAEGIETLDLFALFAAARRGDGDPLYLDRDTHWSPRAMAMAAEAAAKRLLELGWVTPGETVYSFRDTTAEREGDIVAMMQSPVLSAAFPKQTVRCEQVVDASGALFHAAPTAEVVVLGDSFCRIYETDAPGAAGFIAHLAQRLGQPVAGIVNDGGAATAVRQTFAGKPALAANVRTVIWQFAERDLTLDAGDWKEVTFVKPINK